MGERVYRLPPSRSPTRCDGIAMTATPKPHVTAMVSSVELVPRRRQRWLTGTPAHLLIIGVAALAAFAVTRIGVISPVEPTYAGILDAVLTDMPDPVLGDAANDYPLTHALALMAATAREDDETAQAMVERLRDSQLPTGWGATWELDAFGDGTINPTSTAYAFVTAMALHALSEADAGNDADGEVAAYWSTRLDAYSDQPTDDIWVPSSAAMIASAVARFGYGDEAQAIFDRLREDRFRWPYSQLQEIPNDLQNYVYILWAGEVAREHGVRPPWDRGSALGSLDRYGEVYPTDVPLTPDMEARSDSPWELSGAGMALAFTARYGDVGDWFDRTVMALEEARFVPRYAAHALLGVALGRSPSDEVSE